MCVYVKDHLILLKAIIFYISILKQTYIHIHMCTLHTYSYIRRNRCSHNPAWSTADPVHKHRNRYTLFLSGTHCAL